MEVIYSLILPLAAWAALILTGLYVRARGGRAERRVWLIAFAMFAANLIGSFITGSSFLRADLWILLVDGAALAAFTAIALRTERFWPLWTAACQTLSTMTHLAVMTMPDFVPTAYALMQGFWSYPLLATIVVGTWSLGRPSGPPAPPSTPRTAMR